VTAILPDEYSDTNTHTSAPETERYAKDQRRDPGELLDDLDGHVGDDGKFVNRSDAVRASIRKTLDVLDEIDARHDRLADDEAAEGRRRHRPRRPAGGDDE